MQEVRPEPEAEEAEGEVPEEPEAEGGEPESDEEIEVPGRVPLREHNANILIFEGFLERLFNAPGRIFYRELVNIREALE